LLVQQLRQLGDVGCDPTWLNAPKAKGAKKARKKAAKRLRYFADDFPGAAVEVSF
jgi:hypothetical protein